MSTSVTGDMVADVGAREPMGVRDPSVRVAMVATSASSCGGAPNVARSSCVVSVSTVGTRAGDGGRSPGSVWSLSPVAGTFAESAVKEAGVGPVSASVGGVREVGGLVIVTSSAAEAGTRRQGGTAGVPKVDVHVAVSVPS